MCAMLGTLIHAAVVVVVTHIPGFTDRDQFATAPAQHLTGFD
jgi:hypothetical protein